MSAGNGPGAGRRRPRRGDGRGPHLVVVGDAVLDRDVVGRADRLCPDAAAPVVDVIADLERPGGAGLAAWLAARRGAAVTLVTAVGDDPAGRRLAALLAEVGVDVVALGTPEPTAEKVRVRVDDRSLVRIDRGSRHGTDDLPRCGPSVLDRLAEVLGDADGVLVADYGRGVTSVPALRALLRATAATVPIVWDPHPRGATPVAGCRLVTPNEREVRELAARRSDASGPAAPAVPGRSMAAAVADALQLAQHWRVHGVAVTRGAEGAVLVSSGDGGPFVALADPVQATDTCGAGDAFAAAATLALAAGATLSEAVDVAVAEATVFVADGGAAVLAVRRERTDPADPPDPAAATSGRVDPVASSAEGIGPAAGSLADAVRLARAVRARGGTVVATGGCFDLLHPGHVQLLRSARRLGDCLVVLVNSDRSVRALKGPDRPIQGEADRAAVLAALGSVDAVVVFDDPTPVPTLEVLRPDVFAKGGDYRLADLPEAAALASWGGQAVILPYLAGRSTSRLVSEARRVG